jgi:hypothetical protein
MKHGRRETDRSVAAEEDVVAAAVSGDIEERRKQTEVYADTFANV